MNEIKNIIKIIVIISLILTGITFLVKYMPISDKEIYIEKKQCTVLLKKEKDTNEIISKTVEDTCI